MVVNRHISNASIIITEYMTLRDDISVIKNNEFLNLEIEGDSKIIIDCNYKKNNIHSSIMLLMKDI